MIDLTIPKYKANIKPEDILKYISDYDIFKYYLPGLELGKAIHSPLRTDTNPSFSVFFSKKYNKLFFKDLATGERGDCFVFVSRLYTLKYPETLREIIIDFELHKEFGIKQYRKSKNKPKIHTKEEIDKKVKEATKLRIKRRDWKEHDIIFWKTFGISSKTLKKYRVFPIQYIFINDEIIVAEKYAYVYIENKDNEVKFKIYQPFSKNMKWINNMLEGTISGWEQLPNTDKLLIIASSLKDSMCLNELGYNVLNPQTENYIFKKHIIEKLKQRFNKIIVFYDEDKAGKKAAYRMKEMFNINFITTEDEENKDPSDYYKKYGKKELKRLIDNKLQNL